MLLGGLLAALRHRRPARAAAAVEARPPPGRLPPAAAAGRAGRRGALRVATGALAAFAALALAGAAVVAARALAGSPTSSRLRRDRRVELAASCRWIASSSGASGSSGISPAATARRVEAVDLYAAVGNRGLRSRSVLFTKALLPGSGWNTQEQGAIRLEPGGIEATWRVAVSGTRRFLVISWQEAGGRARGRVAAELPGPRPEPAAAAGRGRWWCGSARAMTGSGPGESRPGRGPAATVLRRPCARSWTRSKPF